LKAEQARKDAFADMVGISVEGGYGLTLRQSKRLRDAYIIPHVTRCNPVRFDPL
jgi:hypothetical protein